VIIVRLVPEPLDEIVSISVSFAVSFGRELSSGDGIGLPFVLVQSTELIES